MERRLGIARNLLLASLAWLGTACDDEALPSGATSGGTSFGGQPGLAGGEGGLSPGRLLPEDWRIVVAPAATVYEVPYSADSNLSGWWDGDQLHFEPGDWARTWDGDAASKYYIGTNLGAALASSPLSHVVHATVRDPQGCLDQGKSVCLWAESTYHAGNGVVYALTEDEAYRPCSGRWHWRMAIARSVDNGVTFDDLGIVLDEPGPEVCDTSNDYLSGGLGDGNWVIPGDGYAYVVYSVYGGTWSPTGGSQGLGVARILLTDLADPASMDPVTGEPNGPSQLRKWRAVRDADGIWKVPDDDGNPTATRCADANDCFNADGITGVTTPIPGSYPRYDNLAPADPSGPSPTDLWYFPTAGFVRRGSDQVTVILASHISQTGGWYYQADLVGAWLGDIAHPETLRGPTVAFWPCFGELSVIGSYLTLFGDRADTFDTPAAMTGEDADGTPRPIPLFGLTYDYQRPRSRWTLTFCKPGETSGACHVGTGASSFAVGSDVSCPP